MKNLDDLPTDMGDRTRKAATAILVAMDNNPEIQWWTRDALIEIGVMMPSVDPILPRSAQNVVYQLRRLGFIRGRKRKGERQRRYTRIR